VRGRGLVLVAALLLAVLSVVMLERARGGVATREAVLAGSPVTVYRPQGADGPLPPVIVAHGFAGSRAFMDALSRAVARAGFTVVSFDFDGHGRNPRPLSPDVTRIEGTTAELVDQTLAVTKAARDLPEVSQGPVSFLGHSMATDIVVRAAARLPDDAVASVVVLSMYSDAVTRALPRRLLALSGQWEGHLRAVALRAVRQVVPGAVEGQTVRAGAVERRVVVAPLVGHVGVLFSPVSVAEARDWMVAGLRSGVAADGGAAGVEGVASAGEVTGGAVARTGPWILVLLGSLPIAVWAAAGPVSPAPASPGDRGARRDARVRPARLVLVAIAAGGLGITAVLVAPGSLLGLAAFGGLAAFFLGWGVGAVSLLGIGGPLEGNGVGLRSAPGDPARRHASIAMVMACAAAILAIDRYVSSFVPTGPRIGLFLSLIPAFLPFGLAEARLAVSAGAAGRLMVHGALAVALAGAMALAPARLALAFTAVPVTVLFLAMFGTMAGIVARRGGAGARVGVPLATAVLLAWSIAASTPLFRPG
jgi:pimeloyl-ACP methyl ester carboxylesterase